MQIRVLPALFLFLGSYFPLSLILLFQNITSLDQALCFSDFLSKCTFPTLATPFRTLSFLGVCFISLLFFLWSINQFHGQHEIHVVDAKSIPNDLINYVFPYVVSFMGLDLGDSGKFYGFLLFLGWMFVITYQSGQILMNPLLLVSKWQLYDVQANIEGHARQVRALSRTPLHPHQILMSCVIQGVYVLSKKDEKNQNDNA